MPPRWLCLLILLFWLSFNGWLFFHDLLPRLLPHQPPPYTIDLAEEAQLRRPYIDWTVLRDDHKVFRAKTAVSHPEYDVFEMSSEFIPFREVGENARVPISGFLVRKMSSVYRVNAAGDLLGLSVHIEASPDVAETFALIIKLLGVNLNPEDTINLDIAGEVTSGRLVTKLRAGRQGDNPFQVSLPEVAIARGNSVLLPLHPVNRLRGISPGQNWRIALLDPLQALFQRESEPPLLQAHVRPELENFSWGRRLNVPCMVIDYTGDDFTARTWVAQDRGLVLCQEANIDGHHWVMYRD